MASSEAILNSRFKLLERPVRLPASCAVCGAVDRPVIDFNLDLDFYGTVNICVECLREAADIAGILDDTDKSQSQAAPLLPIDYEGFNEFIRSMGNALDRINLIIPDHVISLVVSKEDDTRVAGSDEDVIPEPQRDDESRDESAVSEGPNDSSGALGGIPELKF